MTSETTVIDPRRVKYIQDIMPRACEGGMQEEQFLRVYGRWRFQSRDIMQQMEKHDQCIHCRNCMKEHQPDGMTIHAHRMMCTIEKDLLGNFPSVIKLTCFGCGTSEMVPCQIPFQETQKMPSYAELYKQWRDMEKRAYSDPAAEQQMRHMQKQAQRMAGMGSMMGQAASLLGGMGGGDQRAMTATEIRLREEEMRRYLDAFKNSPTPPNKKKAWYEF